MIRTRDMLITMIVFLCLMAVVGFVVASQSSGKEPSVREHTPPEAVFLTPKETYGVATYVDDTFSDTRETFIEKVRSTYPKKETPIVPEVTISAPVTPTPPTIQATTTYGDTGF